MVTSAVSFEAWAELERVLDMGGSVEALGYMKERLARGELRLPDDARPLSSFGQEGKVIYERGAG